MGSRQKPFFIKIQKDAGSANPQPKFATGKRLTLLYGYTKGSQIS